MAAPSPQDKSRDRAEPGDHRRLQPWISFFSFISGPFLWLPRTWTRAAVRAGTRFNFSLRGKARDFNWHNVIGFWTCIPLAVIVLCAVVMSYPWANNLVYKMTGNPPPPPNAQQPAGASSRTQTVSEIAIATTVSPSSGKDDHTSPWAGLDAASHHAEERVPAWRTITVRLASPSDPNLAFSIDSGNGGRPDERSQLTLNRKTGAEVRWEPFSSYNSGRQLRAWIRFTHTGEAGGITGQSIAAIAAAGGAMLAFTGLSLGDSPSTRESRASSQNATERAANRSPLHRKRTSTIYRRLHPTRKLTSFSSIPPLNTPLTLDKLSD